MEIKPKDVYYWQLLQTANSTYFLWPWEDDQGSSSFPFSQVLFWWLNNACNHCFSIVHVSLWVEEEAKKKRVPQQRDTKVCDCLGFVCVLVLADSLQPHGLQPTRLLCPWGFPGKDTGVVCCFHLQGIFPTQGLNLGLLNCKQILYWLSYQGSCSICSLGIISKILPLFFLIHLSPSKSFFLHVFLYSLSSKK